MTTYFKELQLDTTLSLAVIAAGLMISGFGYSADTASQSAAREGQVTVSQVSQDEGHYRMTVTAQRPRDFVPAPATAQAAIPAPATRT